MIIKNGYWNYYFAFRIKNYESHLKEIEQKETFSGVLAIIANGSCTVFEETRALLENRKSSVQNCRAQLDDSLSTLALQEMYNANQLPEFFWDFDDSLNDLLEQAIFDSIERVQSYDDAYTQMFGPYGNDKCQYYVLMPLKVYFSEWDYVYCRVYIQLFTSGNGMIKLEMPLKDVPVDCFGYHTDRRWYLYIKAWDALRPQCSEDAYKKISSTSENDIMDIVEVLSSYVQKFFSESIIDETRFLSFETFVISNSMGYNILDIDQKNAEGLRQLYHFARPEDFAMSPSVEELKQFWSASHFNVSGIHVIKGVPDRLILYALAEELQYMFGRVDVPDRNEYLQASISRTYDTFILLALAQKDNAMTIYQLSQQNLHSISRNMTHYYANANYLDSIFILAETHGRNFYNIVLSLLDESLVDFQEMLSRIQCIEEYEKLKVSERRNRILHIISLIFTVLFGLPFIYDTLTILKRAFHNVSSGISLYTIGKVSFIIWIILLFFVVANFANNYLEYLGCGINTHKPIISQVKSLIRATKIIFKTVFNKN